MALLQVLGVDLFGLLDTGATPKVVYRKIFKRLHLNLEKILKVMTVTNGAKSGVLGKVGDIPVSF